MKKLYSILVMAAALLMTMPAQAQVKFGFRGGANLVNMKLSGKDALSTVKLSNGIGIEIGSALTLHMKLALIAKYFNGTWKPEMDKTKYFLGRTPYSYDLPNSAKLNNGYYIGIHERVMYPGIVYFQKQEDVRKAYEMLKDELMS